MLRYALGVQIIVLMLDQYGEVVASGGSYITPLWAASLTYGAGDEIYVGLGTMRTVVRR